MKTLITYLFSFIILFNVVGNLFAQNISNLNLLNHFDVRPNQPPSEINSKYTSIWGWTSPSGKEYAIMCCVTGTSFIDISNSSNVYECDFIRNYSTINRECKTFLNYAYITSDAYGLNWTGLQIVDLSYLPDSVHLVKNWIYENFKYAHTLFQENTFLYLCGGNVNAASGLTIIDISDPENPVKRAEYLRAFVHECYVRNDTIYAAVTGVNKFIILDAVNKDSIAEIAEINNLPGYVAPHSTWLSEDGKFLITSDESRGPPGIIAIWNIDDLTNIKFVTTYRPPGDSTSIAHTTFVKRDILYLPHHTAGLRLVDIRIPGIPVEFAFHDTYPGSNAMTIEGNGSCYPYFNSGKIISSDMQTGLYVHTIIDDPTRINSSNVSVIKDFSLYQNYPNPFNPVTNLEFGMSKLGFVTLKVYDVLGNEVATLVNEMKNAGRYNYQFSIINYQLASGIYFYSLYVDGSLIDTKKMILLK